MKASPPKANWLLVAMLSQYQGYFRLGMSFLSVKTILNPKYDP